MQIGDEQVSQQETKATGADKFVVPKWSDALQYPVTAGLVVLAVAITLAWWARVDISPLFESVEIRRGQLWRLLTSILPHISIIHLIFNVYWVWIFGSTVERAFGHAKTAQLILLFAFTSNSFDFGLAQGGVGLSGVGYGLFGLLWILSRRDERFRSTMPPKTVHVFLLWFVFCIVTTIAGVFAVANVAHGAGAVIGILTGYAITTPVYRRPIIAGIACLSVFGLWTATLGRPLVNLSGNAGYEEGQLGYRALLANRNQEAVRWFKDAAKQQPKVPEFWYDLGIAYQRVGNISAASDAYQRAHRLAPNDPQFANPFEDTK